jgi:hypothetical protein
VLQQEFKAYLNTTANITTWRHAAIAISQKHLRGAKFKQDYSLEPAPTWVAEQTGYTAYVTGNVYAREIEEAPGYVASARAEYRALSRTWHSFLSFGVYLSVLPPNSLKRPREESSKGIKDSNMSSCIGEVKNIEAEIQRRVKTKLEAEVEKRVKEALLRINELYLPQVKQQKTKRIEQVVIELGEEVI